MLALAVVDNVLNLFNVESYYQQFLKGLIILVAVLARRKKVLTGVGRAGPWRDAAPSRRRKEHEISSENCIGAAVGAGSGSAWWRARRAEDIKIGMVNLSLCCAYFVGMDAAVKDEATAFPERHGAVDRRRTATWPSSPPMSRTCSSQDVDGIIISGAWIEAAPEALDAIKAANVPVVLVDRLLKGGDYTSWIGPGQPRPSATGSATTSPSAWTARATLVVLRGGPADNSIGLGRTNGVLSVKVEEAEIEGGEGAGFRRLERSMAASS